MIKRTLSQHLDAAQGPKRILTLDGGGLRGVLTLGILRDIERILRTRASGDPDFRLSDYFDLIAGTSTGAIIAAGLTLGMSVDEIQAHYLHLGDAVFKKSMLRKGVLRAKYPVDKVREALLDVFQDRTLGSPDLLTGLLVVTKRSDTGSVWAVTNNPQGRYFERGRSASTIPNKLYPLWQVVRASTAAPSFFAPEEITIGSPLDGLDAVRGEFVDGGVSPHNNPALLALMVATIPGYGFNWRTGRDALLLISVGTGRPNVDVEHRVGLQSTAAMHAVLCLKSLMDDCSDQAEALLQWLCHSPNARTIDRTMGNAEATHGNALATYLRYNPHFTTDWFKTQLGEDADATQLKALEAMDEPNLFGQWDRIGQRAGAKLVCPEHFPPTFDLP